MSATTTIAATHALEKAESSQGTPEPKSPREIHGISWVLVVMSIISCVFLFALDNTSVADVQPAIIKEFGDLEMLPWISVAFLIGAASTLLAWSKGYGQFDCKWLYILTTLIFEVGSALCGAAPNMSAFIVGRAICGLGGAGGAFTDSPATWRWAFYINLCIGGLPAPVFLFMIPSIDPRPGVSLKSRLAEIDFLGTTLFIGVFVSGIMAIAFGGLLYAWDSAQIIALFVCFGVLAILFFLQQHFLILTTYQRRIFPLQYFKDKEMMILFIETAAAGTSSFIPIYFVPLFFQFVQGDGALQAGVRLLPSIVPLVVFNLVNGAAMSTLGYYMPWYLAGGALIIVGGALLEVTHLNTSVAQIYGALVVAGIGTGSFSQTGFSVAASLVPPEETSTAVGFMTCGQIGGSAVALSVANTIFLNRATVQIARLLPGETISAVQGMVSGANGALLESLGGDLRGRVLDAIVRAITDALVLELTSGALAVLLALFLRRTKSNHDPANAAFM
ncbi:hypothetical protein N8T08_006237 [Aspergillus melleus]|uniref:Uncharacterized protein n=1 Tax=Aspergillus melleus TaxID=138277 RepID=A0ACC3B0Q2_9EURO|nr:hypothetical protein N8T08_006237 [Aspergillus melleus]